MNSKALYLRLLQYLKPYRSAFGFAIFCIAIFALTEPVLPALMQPLLDGSFIQNTDTTQPLWQVPMIIMGLFFIRGILFFLSKYLLAWVSQSVVRDLRSELFQKITNLPAQYFNHNPSGKIISKITYDISQVAEATTETLIVLVRDSLTIIGLLAFLIYTSWKMALFILVLFPIVAILIRFISKRLRTLSHSTQDNMGQLTHVLEEAINGQRITKIFAGQKYEQNKFSITNNALRRFFIKLASTSAASISIIQLFNAVAVACVIYFALTQAQDNQLSVGQFVAFLGGLAMLWPSVKRLTQVNERLQRGLAAAESVFAFADQTIEPDNGHDTLVAKEGEISCKDVNFHYQENKTLILNKLSLHIKPKQIVALVGESGSGKSSLVQLLPRLYNLQSGSISIDGQNTQGCTLKSLRQHISYVDQNITLFNDTISNNIAYGIKASHIDIVQAAKDAEALGFIEELPNGFDTIIGSNGALLSGGQRQRLAIARALLKPAPILILDEATSALDQVLEKSIQETLLSLKNKRTVIIITHRLSAITKVDNIFLFDKGKVSESGTHEELIQNSSHYQNLFNAANN